eukprot:m.104380 g.104380  ORF g.104380 m.104380 type:complete len:862 (-) comp12636_c0_seq2:99-2684(-)
MSLFGGALSRWSLRASACTCLSGSVKHVDRWTSPVLFSSARSMTSSHQEVADSWQENLGRTDYLDGKRPDKWWTGKAPIHGVCPGVDENGHIRALPQPNLNTTTRKELRDYFDNCWTMTEVVFSALQGEEPFYRPPYHDLRHPKIFYYAHTASVYVNKMRVAGLIPGPLNPYYEHIFETGVDEMQWDDLSKNHMMWPSVEEVRQYRKAVYDLIVDVIENSPEFETANKLQDSPFWSVVMGTEHEKIHLETSSVLMRELPTDVLRVPENYPPLASLEHSKPPTEVPVRGEDYPENELVGIKGGNVILGKPDDFPSYGWDNEYGYKKMSVKPFQVSKFKVSNGDFYEFVADAGYLNESVWEATGWKWRCFRNVKWPTFWIPSGPSGLHQYRLRTVFEVVDMPWDWPIMINYHEAKAYTNWKSDKEGIPREKGYRLLTEAEHNLIREDDTHNESLGVERDHSMVSDGLEMAEKHGFNLNLSYGSESPVNGLKPNSKGVHDVFGNAWEWCEDHFSALENFNVHPYYNDFSIPCFDGEHNLILGGSFISCGDEASIFARFHFRPHFFQHSGLRLVLPNEEDPSLQTSCMDNQGPYVGENPFRSYLGDESTKRYEAEVTLSQYIHLHYGTDDNTPAEAQNYSKNVVDLLSNTMSKDPNGSKNMDRVLDVGCAVGGVSFQLAKHFRDVMGIDISGSFIEIANELKASSVLPYELKDEGEIKSQFMASLPQDTNVDNVTFKHMDAMCIPGDIGSFDAVVAANVLDRISSPNTLLARLGGPHGIVRPGGYVLISSPYTWSERFTPRDLWVGGKMVAENGEPYRSIDGLHNALDNDFDLISTTDLPFTLREHSRLFEYVASQASIWRRKQQ